MSTFGTILAVSAEDKFKAVREKAAQGQLVIFRPDGKYQLLPALRKDAVSPEMVAAVERMMPSKTRRNVAAISDTTWAVGDKPSLQSANQAIPFFGLLMGFTSIGHSVWIFDGAADIGYGSFDSGNSELFHKGENSAFLIGGGFYYKPVRLIRSSTAKSVLSFARTPHESIDERRRKSLRDKCP